MIPDYRGMRFYITHPSFPDYEVVSEGSEFKLSTCDGKRPVIVNGLYSIQNMLKCGYKMTPPPKLPLKDEEYERLLV